MKSQLENLRQLIRPLLFILMAISAEATFPGDTIVYYDGGKRGHIESCPRLKSQLSEGAAKAKLNRTSLQKMQAEGGQLCSRCPGSELNKQRLAGSSGKGSRKPDGPPSVEYDAKTKVYTDALWLRVHAEDCPSLILKERKKTITLAEADKAGYRIGESGQSGREDCCLKGYRRKHPMRKLPDDIILFGNDLKKNVKHLAGCHRTRINGGNMRKTKQQWIVEGFKVCGHCIERGPSVTTISEAGMKRLPSPNTFVSPEGWMPEPFSPERSPSGKEVALVIQETLANGYGIQELPFDDPLASLEQFMGMRFFFPVTNWLHLYQAYRATGDRRLLDALRVSASHYQKLCTDYPDVAQLKAKDPEGMAFMYSMAVSARITLQLAQKHPDQVTPKDVAAAEASLKAMISVLKPICEGNDSLDPEMAIPRKLADDFRSRASNRAMNGIGTLGVAAAALEDLQAVKSTTAYQPSIDRYRKIVGEYVKHFEANGHLCTKEPNAPCFIYPYGQETKPRIVDGCKIFNRPEDGGHYSHCLQGLMLLHEAMPEVGIDDDFMKAIANAVYHNSTHRVQVKGKKLYSGFIQCPFADSTRPVSKGDWHPYSPARDRFYMLEAFRPGMIDGLCSSLSDQKKIAANSTYEKRLKTLHAHYLKALRMDRSLIHLGEK